MGTEGGRPGAVRARDLARAFFWIGLTSYGGPAIVARIREVTVRRGWLSTDQFDESLAFCQTLPGPIVPQTAAHVGYRLAGMRGFVVSHLAYVLPAFFLMLGLSAAYVRLGEVPAVAAALRGLGAVVVAVVAHAILSLAPSALRDWRGVTVALLSGVGLAAGMGALPVLLSAGLVALLLRAELGLSPPATSEERTGGSRSGTYVALCVAALALAAGAWSMGLLDPILPRLAWVFTKVDLLAFGGGYTAIALMFDQVVTAHGWLTAKEFVDGLALSQVTPGPVIVNATFVGYKTAGFTGALVATAAVFFPTALLLAALSPLYGRLREFRVAAPFIRGLLAAFIAVLFSVLVRVAGTSLTDLPACLMAIAAFGLFLRKVEPTWVILGALGLSLIVYR